MNMLLKLLLLAKLEVDHSYRASDYYVIYLNIFLSSVPHPRRPCI